VSDYRTDFVHFISVESRLARLQRRTIDSIGRLDQFRGLLAPSNGAMRKLLRICDNTGEMYNIVFNASKSKCIMVNARRKLAICALNCIPSFSIGGNSIEVFDECHKINRHFTDDMDITLCKTD